MNSRGKKGLFGILLLFALLLAPLSLQRHEGPLPVARFLDDRGIPSFDNYTSNCRRSGHTSFMTQNVDLIQWDGVVQKGSNLGCLTPQNEPSLAINPANPENLVAGANDYRLCCDSTGRNDGTGWAYVSKDGGAHWRNVLLPGLTKETAGQGLFDLVDSAGDPSVAFSPDGKTVAYANIVFSRANDAYSGIAVSISHDGGSSWLRPHMVYWSTSLLLFNDKEWVTFAPDGHLLVSWTQFVSLSPFDYASPIVGATSRDGADWSKVFAISDLDHFVDQGSQPLFAPDGTLYVPYQTTTQHGYAVQEQMVVTVKRPGVAPQTIPLGQIADCYPVNQDRRATLTGEQFRVSAMPAAALDPSSGTLAVVWADDERGCDNPNADTSAQVKIVFINGTHHSAPQIISSGADKAFPAVAYRDGRLVVSYYSRSFSPSVGLDYSYAVPEDGWVEHRLSDGSSDPYEQFKGSFIGDYTALATGSDGVTHALWTDSRGGDQNIFTATIPAPY